MNKDYPYIVKPVDKNKYDVNYIVEFIDFPGITGGGDTTDEAIEIANEALEMYIEVLTSEGKEIPAPTHFNTTGRVTLRLPKSMHLRVVELANRDGVSLNTYIIDALSQKLYGTDLFDEVYKKITRSYAKIFQSSPHIENETRGPMSFFNDYDAKNEEHPLKFGDSFKYRTTHNRKENENHVFAK